MTNNSKYPRITVAKKLLCIFTFAILYGMIFFLTRYMPTAKKEFSISTALWIGLMPGSVGILLFVLGRKLLLKALALFMLLCDSDPNVRLRLDQPLYLEQVFREERFLNTEQQLRYLRLPERVAMLTVLFMLALGMVMTGCHVSAWNMATQIAVIATFLSLLSFLVWR